MGIPFHGHYRNRKMSPTYRSWVAMKYRCHGPGASLPSYKRHYSYAGKGITVCHRWLLFVNFLADMGERPKGTTLDRIHNELGYFAGNCRWADKLTQRRNQSNIRILTVHGETRSASEFARIYGITLKALCMRLASGWSDEDAVLLPFKKRRSSPKNQTVLGRRIVDWARELGISAVSIRSRLANGWSEKDAVTTPARRPGPPY